MATEQLSFVDNTVISAMMKTHLAIDCVISSRSPHTSVKSKRHNKSSTNQLRPSISRITFYIVQHLHSVR